MPVETVLKFRFESILQKYEFTEWNKKFITLFINTDLDPEAFGSTYLRKGFFVGVPEYYQRLSNESIKKSVTVLSLSMRVKAGFVIDRKF